MEEKIIRPSTKPEAIKGKLLKYQGTDYCEFLPQAQGEPQYEGISKTRNSQLKRSKGKAPKLVAHLTAKAESIDPYADMMEELGRLFPDNKKGMPNPHGRRLLAEPEVDLRLNTQERQLECHFKLLLAGNVRYTDSLFTIFSKINSCLAYNQDSLKPLVHAAATTSGK
jgi:hypothetical protein